MRLVHLLAVVMLAALSVRSTGPLARHQSHAGTQSGEPSEGDEKKRVPVVWRAPEDVPRSVPESILSWSQVDTATILLGNENNGEEAYNSGRATDVLPLSQGGAVVASETGGVWIVASTGFAIPVSNDWSRPNMSTLTFAMDNPDYVYAAGAGLYVTDYKNPFPLLNWIDVTPETNAGVMTGEIYKVAYLSHDTSNGTKHYIALGTKTGLWYSELPPVPNGPYNWQRSKGGLEGYLPTTGLAPGPEGTGRLVISIANRGSFIPVSGIFYGDFDSSGNLVLKKAAINSFSTIFNGQNGMIWTSLDSCKSDATRMYGILYDMNGAASETLRSNDAGVTWNVCARNFDVNDSNNTVGTVANWLGDSASGGVVKHIAVNPANKDQVTVTGLLPLLSMDGGASWSSMGGSWTAYGKWTQSTTSFHVDWHTARFDPANSRILAATDGGLLDGRWNGGGYDFYSRLNSHLYTMQHYSSPVRNFVGYFDFSQKPGEEGLCASGLQDNGTIVNLIQEGPPGPWLRLTGGDGGWNTFVQTSDPGTHGKLVNHYLSSVANEFEFIAGSWFDNGPIWIGKDKNGQQDKNGLAATIQFEPDHLGYTTSDGRYLLAVAAGSLWDANNKVWVGAYNEVYGLFGDPQAGSLTWRYIGKIPQSDPNEFINAMGSWDGTTIVIGTVISDYNTLYKTGRIIYMDTATGTTSVATFNAPFDKGAIFHFVISGPRSGFAIYNRLPSEQGSVLSEAADGSWSAAPNGGLPNRYLYDITIDTQNNPKSLYVCTAARVYRSDDGAASWIPDSAGLPEYPYNGDLHIVTYPDGERYLYLATYGRSLWRARLTRG